MITESHANQMLEQEKRTQTIPNQAGCSLQIGELDGSMLVN